jgi:hypothetical protein
VSRHGDNGREFALMAGAGMTPIGDPLRHRHLTRFRSAELIPLTLYSVPPLWDSNTP